MNSPAWGHLCRLSGYGSAARAWEQEMTISATARDGRAEATLSSEAEQRVHSPSLKALSQMPPSELGQPDAHRSKHCPAEVGTETEPRLLESGAAAGSLRGGTTLMV